MSEHLTLPQEGGTPPTGARRPNGLPELPAAVLQRFSVESELGRGSMGAVFRAFDQRLARQVALKVLYPMRGAEEDLQQLEVRFLREAQLAARLTHPNIVTIFDILHEQNQWILVMELVQGHTLRERLRMDEQISVADACSWAMQAAQALACAHAGGVIHRDIKPENLMLQGDGRVRIMDFGVAISSDSPRVTLNGRTLGTPAYFAPELLLGQESSERSDLFALGVLLYELLAGHNPFAGDEVLETLKRIVHTRPPTLDRVRAGLPPGLSALVEQLMHPDPAQRISSATMLIQRLEVLGQAEPVAEDVEAATLSTDGDRLLARGPQTSNARTVEGTMSFSASPARPKWVWSAMGALVVLAAVVGWNWPFSATPSAQERALHKPAQVSSAGGASGAAAVSSPSSPSASQNGPSSAANPNAAGVSGAASDVGVAGKSVASIPGTTGTGTTGTGSTGTSTAGTGTTGTGTTGERADKESKAKLMPPSRVSTSSSATTSSTSASPEAARANTSFDPSEAQARLRSCTRRSELNAQLQCLTLESAQFPAKPAVKWPDETRKVLTAGLDSVNLRKKALPVALKGLPKDTLVKQLEQQHESSSDYATRQFAVDGLKKAGAPLSTQEVQRRNLFDDQCEVRKKAAQYFAKTPTPSVRTALEKALRGAYTEVEVTKKGPMGLREWKVKEKQPTCEAEALEQALAALSH
ncbi:MAG: serine/threonine-protein kinase [Myxococcota bacterium]